MDPSQDAPGDLNESAEPPPLGQRLFDNMYLLLAVGVVIMLVIFTGWGIWEVVSMPKGTLP
jgi:hypothetical protein